MHTEVEATEHHNPVVRSLADRITPRVVDIPEAEADTRPVALHEIASMLGVMSSYGAAADPTWAGLVEQIPGLAIARGVSITDIWRLPAAEALPALTEHMRHILRSDRFPAAAAELTAISDRMRKLQAPGT